ncbi:hypothetical protein AV530_010914 [Patagioenas fasciata monilis]|uniref:Uncharacterized protein n=1 Tax=Patagioenas fasciata monilis TaxID=372326 RepID=A0A1V4K871_PATFA|nr:hypothetical protein AV530_010914 [Patagioenas fasciata monilis]
MLIQNRLAAEQPLDPHMAAGNVLKPEPGNWHELKALIILGHEYIVSQECQVRKEKQNRVTVKTRLDQSMTSPSPEVSSRGL